MKKKKLSLNHFYAPIYKNKNYTFKPFRWWPSGKSLDQEVCFFCGLRFEPCGCSYDGHLRLTWSLTLGPVRLVKVRASWPGHPR